MKTTPSFAELSAGRANNYDALRCFLAALVIFSHSFIFTTISSLEPLSWLTADTTYLGEQAVNGFFIISGFLISASWLRSPQLGDYFQKRVLRIYPGFIVVSLICLLIIGPIGAASAAGYFEQLAVGRSLTNLLLLNKLESPPTFLAFPVPNQLNGSLWTIKIEFECYILVALLGVTRLLSRRGVIGALFLGCWATFALLSTTDIGTRIPALEHLQSHIQFGTHFLAGMLFFLYRDRIPFAKRWLVVAIVGLGAAMLAHVTSLFTPWFGSYIVFFLVFHPRIKLHNIARYGDFSYGLYLYGWPIQLLVATMLGTHLHPYLFFCISLPLALLAAFGSWHLVEKPCMLLLKQRRLGRAGAIAELPVASK